MKVVLAYSGGLDASVAVKWLQKCYDAEVITFTAEIGQSVDLAGVEESAKKIGAVKTYSIDLRKEFAEEYVLPAIKANAFYQDSYSLHCALCRPLIAKKMVEIAKKEGADAVAHGATGKGNDQIRFDVSFLALEPDLKTIAPAREWGMNRPALLEYAKEHGISLDYVHDKLYAIDENIWGISVEGGDLEDPWNPQTSSTGLSYPEDAPDEAEILEIGFEGGKPVSLDGKEMPLLELIESVDAIGKKHGIGIKDHMEDRVVGLKSREIYQCAAAEILIKAHKDLEKYVSTVHQNHFKSLVDQKWSEAVYGGLWYDPLIKGLNAFIDSVNEKVGGKVKVKLYKGKSAVTGRSSENALYAENLITYAEGDEYDHSKAEHFISLYALPTKIAGMVHGK